MKLKHFSVLIAVLVFCFVMSGCSDVGFTDQALLRPPRATGDTAEIQNIISNQAGGSYILKYPETGEYRSAVTIHNNPDGESYAVALYSTESDSKMNVSIIMSSGKNWKCLGSFTSSATGVDRLIFDDINSDGKDELILGWTSYNGAPKNITSYSVENDAVREMTIDETYNEIVVSDITGDGTDDIILLSPSTSKSASNVKLLQYSEQEKRPISKYALDLDPEVASFSNVIVGKIDSDTNGVVVDGEKSGGLLSTQIIYFDKLENTLKEPLLQDSNNGSFTNATNRKDVITSRDMDDDGIIEVPFVTQLPAPTNFDGGSVCSITSWKQFYVKPESFDTKMNTVINYTDGYYFILPDKWNGNVTAVTNAEDRTMTFYIWNSKTSTLGSKLMTVYRFTKSAWENADKTGYIQLNDVEIKSAKAVIAVQIYNTDENGILNITNKETAECVRAIAPAA